jgi:hypothetical protein
MQDSTFKLDITNVVLQNYLEYQLLKGTGLQRYAYDGFPL